MCRRTQMVGAFLLAFGIGLLLGWAIDSAFLKLLMFLACSALGACIFFRQ